MSGRKIIPRSECPRCQSNHRSGGEVFYHKKRQFKFDVDLAIELVNDGRQHVEVDGDSLRRCLRNTEVDEQHLPHITIGRPGIIANVPYHLADGRTLTGHLLIDGNHRATRCLRDGMPFYAYVLTEEETQRILLRAPATISLTA